MGMSETKAPSAEELAAVKLKNRRRKREGLSMRRRTRPSGRAAVVMARRPQKQSVCRVFLRRTMSTYHWSRAESSRTECRVGRSAEQFAVIDSAIHCIFCVRRGMNPGRADKTSKMRVVKKKKKGGLKKKKKKKKKK